MSFDDEIDLDEDGTTEEPGETIRAKWLFEGAETLSEAAQMLRAEADRLVELERDGWQLQDPVSDDYGLIARTGS